MPEDERFEYVLGRVSEAETLPQIIEKFAYIKELYDIEHVVYHAVKIPYIEKENNILLLTYDDVWVDRYFDQDYFRLDPVVRIGSRGFLPIDWNSLDRSSFETQKFFAEASRFGVGRQGLSLPIHGALGERALFSVTSNLPEAEWRAARMRCMRDFQLIGHFVHDHALRLSGVLSQFPAQKLSRREIQCLELLGRGRTTKQVACETQLSESAVRLYTQSARRKLSAATLTQAVCKAMTLHLIDV